MSNFHIPVLLTEVLDGLNVQTDGWYIDCNLGGGGHTEAILKKGGKVLGIDLDTDAIAEVAKNHNLKVIKKQDHLESFSDHLILYQANFTQIRHIVNQLPLRHPELVSGSTKIDSGLRQNDKWVITGILFDLGVSSFQIEESSRGFSFNNDAPLDMRMDQSAQIPTAADLINGLHEGELAELFFKLGEENFSRPIARAIVEKRQLNKIETTDQLARIILQVRRRSPSDRTHPATKVFQALRIAVNDELNSLKTALPSSFNILDSGGRLIVISFHSLEDRIVKDYFQRLEKSGKAKIINEQSSSSNEQSSSASKKPITPTDKEIEENPRSRSAKLRMVEKL